MVFPCDILSFLPVRLTLNREKTPNGELQMGSIDFVDMGIKKHGR